ncbi:trypsin-like peptidase domain-containing protein [Magnetospirillum sp. SS-4]|uniref:trypsin-like peptidase domain-containing protein n=1 Tax=Magnetospirillum sp. SS-4 TaxID=2681465 RepID=UPI001382DCA6|nr:trypsin-like peptidase domain-containing protein [Magnetospirillum sp. SS-4]CAA7620921.1 Trypsin-like serine protease [Magnetospirillum sp. SS-4]
MGSWRGWVLAASFALWPGIPAEAACTAKPASPSELGQCTVAAQAGDTVAALWLGDVLANAASPAYDPAAAIGWWERAANGGGTTALRRLFDAYWYGRGADRNAALARSYLDRAAAQGAPWARLVRAYLLEGEDGAAAAELYSSLAAEGNCLAQLRMAHGHDRGGWLEKNRSQALFWVMVAAGSRRDLGRPESHPLFESRFRYGDCAAESYFLKAELAKAIPSDLLAKVETSAAAWRPGRLPERQGPVEVPAALGVPPAGHGAVAAEAAKLPQWQPLPASLRRSPGRARMGAEDVFATVGRSVHVVVAARNDDDLRERKVRYGSAVAMDERTLVTNCHVIAEMASVWLRQGRQMVRATPSGGDSETDRCQLTVSPGRLSAVPGVRSWDDLKVGETVYSIGAPRGLEATLGQGLVSGLRSIKGIRYVQTSAPISAGSSGGGLFDSAGNLVGITTFHIRDADGLNFAIAVDDFFR